MDGKHKNNIALYCEKEGNYRVVSKTGSTESPASTVSAFSLKIKEVFLCKSEFILRGACNPLGRVPGWRIGNGLPYMNSRRKIKYLPRTNMHAAYVFIVSGCFYHWLVVR